MSKIQRTVSFLTAVVAVTGLLCGLQVIPGAQGQVQPGLPPVAQPKEDVPVEGKPIDTTAEKYSAVTPVEKTEFRQVLRVARECFLDQDWEEGTKALQFILDNPEDYLFDKIRDTDPRTGKPRVRTPGVKYEARRLLGTMPPDGLKVYELGYGLTAKGILADAKAKGDVKKLTDVVERYLFTDAGFEAVDLLATYYLNRGNFNKAANYFDLLLTYGKKRTEVTNLTWFKAALAHKRAGNTVRYEDIWKSLTPKLEQTGGVKANGQLISVARLKNYLGNAPNEQIDLFANDWLMKHGNPSRSAQGNGSQPLLGERLWVRKTVNDINEIIKTSDPSAEAEEMLDMALNKAKETPGVPILNGFFPIATQGKAIFRTHAGLTSMLVEDLVDAKGNIIAKAGELDWKSFHLPTSLGSVLDTGVNQKDIQRDLRVKAAAWIQEYESRYPGSTSFLYENSLLGSLSADSGHVYTVDDLPVPIPPQYIRNPSYWNNTQTVPMSIKGFILKNNLYAFDIETGLTKWMRGNVFQPHMIDKNPALTFKVDPDFDNSFFLGAPLPIQGKLYVLNENADGEIRLVSLDPETGKLLPPMQTLGTVESMSRVAYDPLRRTHAVHLAFSDGIIVCPTNAGHVFGFDPLSRTFAWTYAYRERQIGTTSNNVGGFGRPVTQSIPPTPATWKSAPPVISNGKLVFTAPDAHSVHCLDLQTGSLLWKKSKSPNDLFLAGVWNDRVLIVGKNGCRARRLSDGEQDWYLTTGNMPSGQGVAANGIYYLP